MLIEELSIDEYIKAWYGKKITKLTTEEAQQAYCEYMDMSGLYQSKEFQQISYINYLTIRIAVIQAFIQTQKDYAQLFYVPFINGFEIVNRYHYKIYWNNDLNEFINQLNKIENKEKKYILELKQKKHIFFEEQNKSKHQRKSLQESKTEFIKNMNTLGKTFRIDRFRTMMDEFALMVKEKIEEQKQENAAKLTKRRI